MEPVFDGIREGVQNDRSAFFKELSTAFYGLNRDTVKVSQGLKESFWRQGMQGSIKSLYDCVQAFSETDQREDLKKMTVPHSGHLR